MAKQLSPATVQIIRQYIDEGLPLENLDMSNANRERVRVAEKVYERLQQDPMLDINRCLMRTFGRTRQQVPLDKQVVEMFLDAMDEPSRKVLTYRARRTAERLVKIGEQTGDAKWIDKGLTQLIRLDRLDEDDVPQEQVKNTAMLPPILVDLNIVNPEKQSISDERFKALIEKYGGKEDDFDKLVAIHARRMRGEDVTMDMLPTNEDDEDE